MNRPGEQRFRIALWSIGGWYVLFIVLMLFVDVSHTSLGQVWAALRSPEIRYAILLSMVSSAISAILAVWVAVPLGYLLARERFWGKWLIERIVDVPIVLPPLVIGLSLLLVFQTTMGRAIQEWLPISYAIPAVILAQFTVSAAFATRTMRLTFAALSSRTEGVAMTLGCTRSQAFWRITLPEARPGIIAAGTLAWARAIGEFGPVLIFAGATRFRTEVLPTTIFLEMSVGNLEAAIAVALMMIAIAALVICLVQPSGSGSQPW